MNYILVKQSEIEGLFTEEPHIGDEVLLTQNHVKVLAGKTIKVISHDEALALIEALNNTAEETQEEEVIDNNEESSEEESDK